MDYEALMDPAKPKSTPTEPPIERARLDWWRYQPVVLISILGLILTFGTMFEVRLREKGRTEQDFTKLADDRAKAIQQLANACVETLNALADLFAASDQVNSREFGIFAGRALRRHDEIAYLEWMPRVSQLQRPAVERGLRITQFGPSLTLVEDEIRPEYYPTVFLEPDWASRQAVGFNHFSHSERQVTMELARDSALPATTPWLRLPAILAGDADNYAMIVYHPIFTNDQPRNTGEERKRNLAGFTAATILIDRLMGRAIPPEHLTNMVLVLTEQSQAFERRRQLQYDRQGRTARLQSIEELKAIKRSDLFWEGAVDVAGQPMLLFCFPTREYLQARRSWAPWLVLTVGLLFTGFLVNYQRVIIQRSAYIERLVEQRTVELKSEIAGRVRVEEELARERDLFHTLLDNLPDRIYFKDRQSRFLRINMAMAKLFGLQHPREALSRSDFDFFTEEHARPAFEDEQEIIRTGQPLIGRVELETLPDGKKGWALTTKMPLRDKSGNTVGTFGISRDITELKRTQDDLRQVNEELQRINAELRSAQMQLFEAEKLQSVGRLAAGVAHEVKNPLAILGMGIDYLAGSVHQNDPEAKGIVEDMRAAIRRADNIILGLLDFAAPRDMSLAARDLNQIIEQALALTKHEQIGTLVTVERRLAANLPQVSLDANKITQVFINLFLNACQAMEQGGRLIVTTHPKTVPLEAMRVEAGTREAMRFHGGETVVEVIVEDTGPGIPPDKMNRIFEPFFTTKPTGIGTGLGLSVTRKIIELHGGHIEVGNRPEGGARFVLWFKTTA